MTPLTQQDFETASEFLDHLDKNPSFRTQNEWQANLLGQSGFVFRGQSKDLPLLPQVFREPSRLPEYAPQTTGSPPDKADLKGWLAWQLQAELRSVFLFLEAADRLGIPTPLDYGNTREHAALLRAAWERLESEEFDAPFPSRSTLIALALAQHHGIPTRLLDWTESPYVASFFAAIETLESTHGALSPADRIYVFSLRVDPQRDQLSEDLQIVMTPRHANRFQRSQAGLFTHTLRANRYLLDNGCWPALENLGDTVRGRLRKITLPYGQAKNLLRLLFDRGITPHSLMPDLDHAARAQAYTLKLFRE